ncbi:MAG TPA: glycosyltransferase family 4 protein [Chryseolinea sp.]|nr:glycosyltransferase family 4 protein [Chryseolinea sp.]
MKKILFIAAHRKDRAPNQRFRFEQYFDYLKSQGFQCELSPLISAADDKVFYQPGHYFAKILIGLNAWRKRFVDSMKRNDYDIIFIAREAIMTGSTFFENRFRNSRAKIVYDFDDSIWIEVVSQNNKALAWLKDAQKTSRIIAMADLVFAGNSFLANYAKQFNSKVVIVPTTIDTELYYPKALIQKERVIIGWSGSVSTLEHFEHAIPALIKIKEKFGSVIQFKVIGDGNYKNEELGIQGLPWKHDTEIYDLQEIDIGIMPLPDNEWTWGKCGLKGLQYMALEIPTIMSAVGVNLSIIQDGHNGFLATTEEEWVQKLSVLIEDGELRSKLGKAGRITVVEHYSVQSQKNKYLEYFQTLTVQ